MSEILLQARNLSISFGGLKAVQDVNLAVPQGSLTALVGPNGAGKTTVFNLLTKFLQPTAGTIRLLDHDITRTDPAKVARMGLVRSFQ
ncbi:ATP-binding cassette domain-containing protein, partial [Leclercia adecarboxylata]|uniref:ATP-binding cassette domain-containing protein n=1 Tax=Leclercia adecarboxylata TaxID=83655 RepID=UPI00234E2400